ncbi:hypothetical protein RSO01_78030 [Reyranella soli]|uniref:Helix-turn-helix domain-containing protein n=2 Tax=Reyranella soli TaxID=1230389 RepID=A0A512NNW5_9HYPH|nr:hypothetical protein RSO01_78030 [Reyranella soli]
MLNLQAMNPPGRPTSYRPDHCDLAREHCLLGATNDELAEVFEVSPRTIDNWIAHHPDFAAAVRGGRRRADAKVAASLYARAVGFRHKVERTFLCRGEPKSFSVTVAYPPDTQACIFWLRNRRRADWRDRPAEADAQSEDEFALLDTASESVRLDNGD